MKEKKILKLTFCELEEILANHFKVDSGLCNGLRIIDINDFHKTIKIKLWKDI